MVSMRAMMTQPKQALALLRNDCSSYQDAVLGSLLDEKQPASLR